MCNHVVEYSKYRHLLINLYRLKQKFELRTHKDNLISLEKWHKWNRKSE